MRNKPKDFENPDHWFKLNYLILSHNKSENIYSLDENIHPNDSFEYNII